MQREEVIELTNNYKNGNERDILKKYFSDVNRIDVSKRTIVFSTPAETGTSYFRLLEPLFAIYRATDEFNLVYTERLTPLLIDVADILLLHRAGDIHDLAHTIMKMWPKQRVKPLVIHNVDDNEFNLPAGHPMKSLWIESGKDKMSVRSIRESDYVETTTRKLSTTFKNYNNNVIITRNRFNWRLPQWNVSNEEKIQRFGDKVVIGWAGLTSHYNDILKMKPILKEIHDKYPNTHFVLAGMAISDKQYKIEIDPNTGKKIFKEEDVKDESLHYRNRVKRLFADFKEDRITIENALPLEEYGRFYSWFDIGIAFIEQNGFNACKSEIKVVEYCKYGAIPVFSNFGGYNDFVEILNKELTGEDRELYLKYKTKMTCDNEMKNLWIDNISFFIENFNSDEIRKLSSVLKKFVENYYLIDNYIDNQIHFYRDKMEENIEREIFRINEEQVKYQK